MLVVKSSVRPESTEIRIETEEQGYGVRELAECKTGIH